MKRGLAIACILAAVVAMGLSFPAATVTADDNNVLIGGQGTLAAQGNGLVAIKGQVELAANANRGVLLVKDLAGDADVDVRGVGGTSEWMGFDVYFGTGAAHITGGHVAVIVLGQDIDLRAHGRGWAYLKGRGSFWVNGEGPFAWSTEGDFASVDDGGADPPPEAPTN